MQSSLARCRRFWPVLCVFAVLVSVLALELKPYDFRLSAVFHMDARTATGNPMPKGFVILGLPSYDGAQYYQVARNIPRVLNVHRWPELLHRNPGSYAYQRFLLPLLAYIVSFGNAWLLPWAFVGINLTALLLTATLLVSFGIKPIYVFALSLSPAAMLAMHFTLAEPLTILLIAFTLLRYLKHERLGTWEILALALAVLAREVNILFVLYFIGWSLLKRRWSDAAKLIVPVATFLGLHAVLYGIFNNIPFFTSTGARQFPGSAALDLIIGRSGYDAMSLSSIALITLFVLPGLVFTIHDLWKRKNPDVLSLGTLAFFCVMLLMPKYIWGSITSIGRVITPVYPLAVLLLAHRDSHLTRLLAVAILSLGLVTGVGLALILHPFTLVS